MTPSSQLGIIYDKVQPLVVASYVDKFGTSQSVKELTGAYTAQDATPTGTRISSEPFTGAKDALTLFVTIELHVATDVSIKLQGRYAEGEPWADLQSVREDTGATAAAHTFTADGTYIVQTSSAYTCAQVRVVAKTTGGGDGTSIVVKGRMVQ